MKKVFFFLLLAFFLNAPSLLAVGEESFEATRPAGPGRIVPERLREFPQATREGQEALREKIEQRKEEIREKLTERKKEIIGRIFERMLRRFQAAIARLENIIGRFEARINKIRQQRDVGNAWEHLAAAKNHLAQAKTSLENLKAKFESLLEAENPKEAMLELRILAKEVKTHLMETHQALRMGVGVLKATHPSPSATGSAQPVFEREQEVENE